VDIPFPNALRGRGVDTTLCDDSDYLPGFARKRGLGACCRSRQIADIYFAATDPLL